MGGAGPHEASSVGFARRGDLPGTNLKAAGLRAPGLDEPVTLMEGCRQRAPKAAGAEQLPATPAAQCVHGVFCPILGAARRGLRGVGCGQWAQVSFHEDVQTCRRLVRRPWGTGAVQPRGAWETAAIASDTLSAGAGPRWTGSPRQSRELYVLVQGAARELGLGPWASSAFGRRASVQRPVGPGTSLCLHALAAAPEPQQRAGPAFERAALIGAVVVSGSA